MWRDVSRWSAVILVLVILVGLGGIASFVPTGTPGHEDIEEGSVAHEPSDRGTFNPHL